MTLHTYTQLTNVPIKYQLPTPYGFQDILPGQDLIGQGHYSKVKGHLHPPNQCSYD